CILGKKKNRIVSGVGDDEFSADGVAVNAVGQTELSVWTMNDPQRRSVAGGRPRVDGNRWSQKFARGRNEWNHASGHIIAERCARKTVRPTNLAFSRLGFPPIAVVAHKDLVCCAVYIDSMRIA